MKNPFKIRTRVTHYKYSYKEVPCPIEYWTVEYRMWWEFSYRYVRRIGDRIVCRHFMTEESAMEVANNIKQYLREWNSTYIM